MKRENTIYLSLWLIVAWLCLFGTSCIHDYPLVKEPVDVLLHVRFSLAEAVTRATDNGTANERKVTTLRILVFEDDGELDKMEYVSDPAGLIGNPLEIATRVKPGDKTFVLIGNEPAGLVATLNSLTRYDQLQPLRLTIDPETGYTDNLPFVSEKEVTIVKGHTAPVEIALKRAVAKTEVSIRRDVSISDVTFQRIQIRGGAYESRLLPGQGNGIAPGPFLSYNVPFALNTTAILVTDSYLYERETGLAVTDNQGTYLYLYLTIGAGANSTNHYYNIPYRIIDTQGVVRNDVCRNYFYRLMITVYSESVRLTWTILDWDEVAEYDKEAGAEDSNVTIIQWDEEIWHKDTGDDQVGVDGWDENTPGYDHDLNP